MQEPDEPTPPEDLPRLLDPAKHGEEPNAVLIWVPDGTTVLVIDGNGT